MSSSSTLADHFRTIAELQGDVAWIIDCATGLPGYISPSAETMLGYTTADFTAALTGAIPATHPLAALCGGLPERLRRHAEGDLSRVRLVREFDVPRPGGDSVPVEVVSMLVTGESGAPAVLVGTLRDISARREFAAGQKRFASMLNHEFRTPLSTIDGAIQRLEVTGAHADEATRQRYRKISAAVDRMIGMLDEYLSPDRLESTGHKDKEHQADPRQLLDEGAAIAAAAGRPVTVEAAGLPAMVRCAPDGLRLALKVMVENAIRYSPEQAPIELTGRAAPGGIELLVRDHGPGVPEQELSRIFDKFFRGSNASGLPGSGLGLYMARAVVDVHGGKLTGRNLDGGGAEFCLSLPSRNLSREKGCT